MKTCIALFRAINVGGRNILPMRELRGILEGLGLQSVRTYIQSGNAVFQTPCSKLADLEEAIQGRVEATHGFRPWVMIVDRDSIDAAVSANPYPEAAAEPKSLHVMFLGETPRNPDIEAASRICRPGERFELTGRFFYLHLPDGIARSKLAAKAEDLLGTRATARNWQTVLKLQAMAHELS